ncbi:metallo-beta-lactamase superfamily protein [Thelonectria olida]|uniref:Metallo-beta-lactamase superfamily protein n=1 Tax=Thelonectria olida TaxID=1576542 RepID=A0A9P8W0M9_9HYPO|nr:metallo-beta-lactamase superfamily protein [Thelonectria olida]
MARDPIKLNGTVWKDWLSSQEASVPHLADVEDVTERVTRILGGNPGSMQLQGTNTYLVGSGSDKILIDTGEGKPLWIENVIKLLEERDIDIIYVLLTHWHGDHTQGVPDLIAYNPAYTDRIYKNNPDPGQLPIADGQVFAVKGATIRAVHTPGHATDHMCFLLEEENALFTGDNILGHGYSVEEDLGEYLRSLKKTKSLKCAKGYPAHGIKIENLPAKIEQYIRHKEFREQQVLEALPSRKNGGGVTVPDLLKRLHGDLSAEVMELALEPFINQVLWKLAEEKRVGFARVRGNRQWFLKERGTRVAASA